MLRRIENYIEITNEKLLCGNESNLRAVLSLYALYTDFEMGNPQFWKKMDSLLEKDLKNKKY